MTENVIAFQGEPGAYSHEACRRARPGMEALPCATFEDTVEAIRSLGNRFKLIPLSNVDRASFQRTLDGPLKGCHFDAIA